RVDRGPVTLLDAATLALRTAHLVLFDRHGVGGTAVEDPLQRGTQVAAAGERVEKPAADDVVALRPRRPQVGVARTEAGEILVRRQRQKKSRGGVENPFVLRRLAPRPQRLRSSRLHRNHLFGRYMAPIPTSTGSQWRVGAFVIHCILAAACSSSPFSRATNT